MVTWACGGVLLIALVLVGLTWQEWRQDARMRASEQVYDEWIARGLTDGWSAADGWLKREARMGEDGYYEPVER